MRNALTTIALLLCGSTLGWSQGKLSAHWEELTAGDFRIAIPQSQGTCLLPFGILEKHGPQLPLGTDLLDARYAALHAVEQEYAVVFPEYYFGQIFEAKHEPGTVAYSRELQLQLLQETTDEMARNGCKKVIIVNGHGGNEHLLPFFAQSQLEKPHDYVVYVLVRDHRCGFDVLDRAVSGIVQELDYRRRVAPLTGESLAVDFDEHRRPVTLERLLSAAQHVHLETFHIDLYKSRHRQPAFLDILIERGDAHASARSRSPQPLPWSRLASADRTASMPRPRRYRGPRPAP